jgi:hypothetical protein
MHEQISHAGKSARFNVVAAAAGCKAVWSPVVTEHSDINLGLGGGGITEVQFYADRQIWRGGGA